MRRRTRRALLGAAAVPVACLAVLGAEVQLARNGADLEDDTPLEHDGLVGTGDGEPLRMVWLGDSTAAGVGARTADDAVPRRVARALDRPVELTVLAVSGDTVADVVREQLGTLADLKPDVVLMSIGANDVTHLTSRAAFRSAYQKVLASIPPGATLVLLGVPDMGAVPRLAQPLRAIAGHRARTLDRVAKSVAREADAVYVDIAGETGPTMRSDTARYFAEDDYHPSGDGYAVWADAVLAQLEPALTQRTRSVNGESAA